MIVRAEAGGAVVVITGATSGIGRSAAHAFAGAGARLVLAARSTETLREVAEECNERGAEVACVTTDITDEAQVTELMAVAVRTFGRIDICVANASVYSYGTFEETPPEVFRNVVETNLFGAIHTARQVLPHFRRQGSGTLILVGSVYSRISSPYVSPYVASKFGLYGFARVLRQELRKAEHIEVALVLPATIDTPIYQHAANYTGKPVHPLPPVVHPHRVAEAIVRNAERPRAVTVVGAVQSLFIPLHALFPRLYDRCVGPLMNLVALRGRGAAASDGTVFEPDPPSNRVSGGWGKTGGLLKSGRKRNFDEASPIDKEQR